MRRQPGGGLSQRQQEVLRGLIHCLRKNGYPPTMRELGKAVGLSSTRTVSDHLNRLDELGYIRRHKDRSRAIEVLREPDRSPARPWFATPDSRERVVVPIVGEVAAGSPILAHENVDGAMALDADVVKDSRSFLLRVRGTSMIEAHICDGDLILIRPQQEAHNGEIVVVMIEDEVTLKRFYRRDGYIELKPENSSMASIVVRPDMGEVRILGRLLGVWRGY